MQFWQTHYRRFASSRLRQLAITGSLWTIAGFGATHAMRLGSNLILSRLLTPDTFGLMTLASTLVTGLYLFSDVGATTSIIQHRRGEEPTFLNTAWTLQVLRSALVWAVAWLAAWPVAQVYVQPALLALLPILGASAFLTGLQSTSLFVVLRRLDVRRRVLFDVIAQAVTTTITVSWAWLSPTIWALVGGTVAAAFYKTVASFWLLPGPRNRPAWDRTALRDILTFGRWLLVATALMFLAEQVDRLLLGKLLPLSVLGTYGIAYLWADMPRSVTGALGRQVFFPAMARLSQLPRPEFRAKILRPRRALVYPMAVGLALYAGLADLLMRAVYDTRYAQTEWMLPLLVLGIWPRLLCNTNEPALLAIGRSKYTALAQATRLVATVAGILLGFQLGGLWGAVVAVALNDLPYYAAINLGLWRERLGALRQDLAATVVMVATLGVVVALRAGAGL